MSTRRLRSSVAMLTAVGLVAACSGDDGEAVRDDPAVVPDTAETVVDEASDDDAGDDDAGDDVDGVLFRPPDGDFEVVFPGDPTMQPLSTPLPDGSTIESEIHIHETPRSAFLVSWTDYPPEYDTSDTMGVLEGARDGAVENIGGQLETSAPITLQDRPGIQLTASMDAGGSDAFYDAIVFIDGQRLYQASGLGLVAAGVQGDVDTFLASFAFTGPMGDEADQ